MPHPVSITLTFTPALVPFVRMVSARSFGRLRLHCLDGIANEVDDHLLDLHRLGQHGGQQAVEIEVQLHTVNLQIVLQQGEHFADEAIQVYGRAAGRDALYERPHPTEDLPARSDCSAMFCSTVCSSGEAVLPPRRRAVSA